ncbi:MAG: type IV toxin-antitoxin system AbiEi family antitoxin domain-containing protein [Clostridia bacterium]|nr:type IV toxin-antitoxin system AbiEi family antitoxin domain-containing protein [Clostridia bacterium]
MKGTLVVRNALEEFKENELIIACKLYKEKLSNLISETAYYKTLQRMCESGELVKIAKGTYHLPKKSKYGIVPPSEKEIITAFTENETGTVVGYSLYNALNLTTQISKTITVMSSALEGLTKSIRNIVVQQVPLEFSKEITNMVHGLEVLQNFNSIQDINYSAFLKYTEELASSFDVEAFKEIVSTKTYKKSTIAFMQEILNHYQVKNNLNEYLSSLSEYKHPRMEELYEAARISQ